MADAVTTLTQMHVQELLRRDLQLVARREAWSQGKQAVKTLRREEATGTDAATLSTDRPARR